jgi:hypothetical protein
MYSALIIGESVTAPIVYTIAAIAKQESSNVAHWLYHHYRLGFDHVFLLSNDCDDTEYQVAVNHQPLIIR